MQGQSFEVESRKAELRQAPLCNSVAVQNHGRKKKKIPKQLTCGATWPVAVNEPSVGTSAYDLGSLESPVGTGAPPSAAGVGGRLSSSASSCSLASTKEAREDDDDDDDDEGAQDVDDEAVAETNDSCCSLTSALDAVVVAAVVDLHAR